jgi:glycerol-3-phosphate acyltransferase PlsY
MMIEYLPSNPASLATVEALVNIQECYAIVAGISAILGHNYTCWLKFKGGKGIATTAGVLIALFPKAFLVCLAIWIIVFGVSRYVSLASIAAAACLPFAAWAVGRSTRMVFVALFMGALAIYKHKANIQRLQNGTENRFGQKKASEVPK